LLIIVQYWRKIVSQSETIRARNSLIWWTIFYTVVSLVVVVGWVAYKLGGNFGYEVNAPVAPEMYRQMVEAQLKPIGQINVGAIPATPAAPAKAAAPADPVLKLIADKGYACLGCHQVDADSVGPSYQKVAAKYKGDAGAAAMLAKKVKEGGVGTWGQMPMPANPTVSDDDMKTIVNWVLASEGGAKAADKPAEAAKPTETKPAEPVPAPKTEAKSEMPAAAGLTTEQATALMTEKGYLCMSCHQVDAKMVGPGYKEVAAKYKGDAGAAAMLAKKVKEGGVGTWGEIPMPPNPTVSDSDMSALVHWILALH
jgi:cytochrome c